MRASCARVLNLLIEQPLFCIYYYSSHILHFLFSLMHDWKHNLNKNQCEYHKQKALSTNQKHHAIITQFLIYRKITSFPFGIRSHLTLKRSYSCLLKKENPSTTWFITLASFIKTCFIHSYLICLSFSHDFMTILPFNASAISACKIDISTSDSDICNFKADFHIIITSITIPCLRWFLSLILQAARLQELVR